jgi:hypothetical protein
MWQIALPACSRVCETIPMGIGLGDDGKPPKKNDASADFADAMEPPREAKTVLMARSCHP